MEKQDGQKTHMEEVCHALGLNMYQLFDAWAEDGTYIEGSPYFFTERGICKGDGEPVTGMLETLAAGRAEAEPLEDYRYRHMDEVGLDGLLGRKIGTKIASIEYDGAEKMLCAISAIGSQDTDWVVKLYYDGHIERIYCASLAEAVDVYNGCGRPVWDAEKEEELRRQGEAMREAVAHIPCR